MNEVDRIVKQAVGWIGYCEKASLSLIGKSMSEPEDFTKGSGYNNFTIFAKDFDKWTGMSVQGAPWCDTFIDSLFVHELGIIRAKQLLGGLSAYTPSSVSCFKTIGDFIEPTEQPKRGDIVFFKNEKRVCHTGLVTDVSGGQIFTIEGNTGIGNGVIPNGGLVAVKRYLTSNRKIAGYGRPKYNVLERGWLENNGQWKYVKSTGEFVCNTTVYIDGIRYHFNENCIMSTGQKVINGERRFFAEDGIVGAEIYIKDDASYVEVDK